MCAVHITESQVLCINLQRSTTSLHVPPQSGFAFAQRRSFQRDVLHRLGVGISTSETGASVGRLAAEVAWAWLVLRRLFLVFPNVFRTDPSERRMQVLHIFRVAPISWSWTTSSAVPTRLAIPTSANHPR